MDIQINYFCLGVKGCIVFGEDGLVFYGKVWCFGVNVVIKFVFDKDVVVGGQEMEVGEYVVFCKLMVKEWMLMFYLYEFGSWGSYVDKDFVVIVFVKLEKSLVMVE